MNQPISVTATLIWWCLCVFVFTDGPKYTCFAKICRAYSMSNSTIPPLATICMGLDEGQPTAPLGNPLQPHSTFSLSLVLSGHFSAWDPGIHGIGGGNLLFSSFLRAWSSRHCWSRSAVILSFSEFLQVHIPALYPRSGTNIFPCYLPETITLRQWRFGETARRITFQVHAKGKSKIKFDFPSMSQMSVCHFYNPFSSLWVPAF